MKRNEVIKRYERNPILTRNDLKYEANSIFNPGAVRLKDGTTLLLCRVEDFRGVSHFVAARSSNGIDNWQIDEKPTFIPEPDKFPEESLGIEDPRIVYLKEFDKYAITYTALSSEGPAVALAFTDDFKNFEKIGIILRPEDKDAAILPEKINGKWAIVHRPMKTTIGDIWISYSEDLKHWGESKLIFKARKGSWWDCTKVGLSTPLIKTEKGWLLLYHGVRKTASGALYRLGVALLDLNDPSKCIKRGDEWILGPEESYERIGDVPNVVFPSGFTIQDDNDTIYIYYGAADTCIGLAITSISKLLEYLGV